MGTYTIIMVVLLIMSILGGQLYRATKKQQENEGEAVAGCLYLSVVIPFFRSAFSIRGDFIAIYMDSSASICSDSFNYYGCK